MTTMPAPALAAQSAPVFPLSMFGPVHLGVDENGEHVEVDLAERNMLLGGEPGAGKSNALNLIVAHGALSADCQLILTDGKQVELGRSMLLRPMTDRIDPQRDVVPGDGLLTGNGRHGDLRVDLAQPLRERVDPDQPQLAYARQRPAEAEDKALAHIA
jgi:hypothetical protein